MKTVFEIVATGLVVLANVVFLFLTGNIVLLLIVNVFIVTILFASGLLASTKINHHDHLAD